MMPRRKDFLFAIPLALGLALAGCAQDEGSDDEAAADESNVNGAAPITMANWRSHPKIKAIRDEVTAIDGSALTKTDNPGCDGAVAKHTDAQGKIRKIVEIGGEGGFEGESTAYYDAAGKLRFLLDTDEDHTGAEKHVKQWRVYFDTEGKIIWQVLRQARGAEDITRAPDAKPAAADEFKLAPVYLDPEAWSRVTGCGPQP